MRDALRVTRVRYTRASDADRATGLLAYIVLHLSDAIEVTGVTLRRTLSGDHVLSWPERRDRTGCLHRLVRPLDADAKASVERQVLDAIVRDYGGKP